MTLNNGIRITPNGFYSQDGAKLKAKSDEEKLDYTALNKGMTVISQTIDETPTGEKFTPEVVAALKKTVTEALTTMKGVTDKKDLVDFVTSIVDEQVIVENPQEEKEVAMLKLQILEENGLSLESKPVTPVELKEIIASVDSERRNKQVIAKAIEIEEMYGSGLFNKGDFGTTLTVLAEMHPDPNVNEAMVNALIDRLTRSKNDLVRNSFIKYRDTLNATNGLDDKKSKTKTWKLEIPPTQEVPVQNKVVPKTVKTEQVKPESDSIQAMNNAQEKVSQKAIPNTRVVENKKA